jgi:transposase
MKKMPIFVREITVAEREEIKAGMRSSDGFIVRRSQILLSSVRKETARQIARRLGCCDQNVRNVIKAFNQNGLAVFRAGSRRPHQTSAKFDEQRVGQLKEILHQSPRKFGRETSLWTLDLLAEVSYENKLVESQVSAETVRATLERFGIHWKLAKHWITSPDPAYLHKKNDVTD